MQQQKWHIVEGEGPLIAASLHSGHEMRSELLRICALDEQTRLREEDPFTDTWTSVAPTRIVPYRSRFEVDLNRSRDTAVYVRPEDAWGLHLWRRPLTAEMIQRSVDDYDDFYRELKRVLTRIHDNYGTFVVLDLHSYNHRRGGPEAPPADPVHNPEVNVGTGSMNRAHWSLLVNRFIDELHDYDFLGRHLDVRENVKFRGRQLAKWVHEQFPNTGCCLALEFKKFWMDEWTGQPDQRQLEAIRNAIDATVPGLMEELAHT